MNQSAMIGHYLGKIVGIVGGSNEGARGSILGKDCDDWIVKLLTDEMDPVMRFATIVVRKHRDDLRMVPEEWLKDTNHRRFCQVAMLRDFQAPDLSNPVPRFDPNFRSRAAPPGTQMVEQFWGSKVFDFMWLQLQRQIETQRKPRENWSFIQDRNWQCGIVFADGTPQTQMAPYGANSYEGCSSWWPVLYVPTCTAIVAYCQAQAVNGARAWRTHASRVVHLRQASQRMAPPQAPMASPRQASQRMAPPQAPPPAASAPQAHQPDNETSGPEVMIVETPGPIIEELTDDDVVTDGEMIDEYGWDYNSFYSDDSLFSQNS